jgi:nucleotide-binding universal stress UspA family protein
VSNTLIEQGVCEMKILLAVDGSAYSDAAVAEVVKRSWPADSQVKIVTVVELPVMLGMQPWTASPDYFELLEKSLRDAAQEVIARTVSKLHESGDKTLQISSEIIEGSPRQTIVEEADKWGADLIMMGSRGLGTWNRLLLGSVSSAVVNHAKCSVEIVRSRAHT